LSIENRGAESATKIKNFIVDVDDIGIQGDNILIFV
jgi:hypothetical protein